MTASHPNRRGLALVLVAVAAAVLSTSTATAQQPAAAGPGRDSAQVGTGIALSLEEAVRLATQRSEALQIANAGVTRATGQRMQARSQYLPQLNGIGSYQRTLASQFEALSGATPAPAAPAGPVAVCAPPIPATATPAERQAALDRAVTCAQQQGGFGGIDFSKVGFGAKNQWVFGLGLSQNLFAGGRISAQNAAADAGLRAAAVEVTAQRAQLALDVTQAYYDAALADRLVQIASATLEQTEDLLRQTTLARGVGEQSEFDLLRAQVTRDNQRPALIQARGAQETAYLRLRQLLDIPLGEPLRLTTGIEDAAAGAAAVPAALAVVRPGATEAMAPDDTSVDERSVVRQMQESLRAQEAMVRVARSQRLPTVSLVSNYQRLYFPSNLFPQLDQGSNNWTVGVQAAVPLFTGGRVSGEVMVARANADESRARLAQVRELAALDARIAITQLQQARAAWEASAGTAEQAARAYTIDQIRYREGIATQTDLAQTRILVQQATANRAVAARDLALARIRIALLRDLPLQLGGASQAPQGNGSATQQESSQPQARSQRSAQAGSGSTQAQFGSTPP